MQYASRQGLSADQRWLQVQQVRLEVTLPALLVYLWMQPKNRLPLLAVAAG